MIPENSKCRTAEHDVILRGRADLTLTGISEVKSFDETGLCLESGMGEISVRGEGLMVESFDRDSGELCVKGRIDAFGYRTDSPKSGFFGKLFR